MDNRLHRALRRLHACGRRYPDAWRIHSEFRSDHAQHADWPEYVFAPRQAARLIVTGGTQVSAEHTMDIAIVGTLAAWRPTQGIYRFANNLLDELWATPVTGDLPGELLRRLPEWCVYIELGKPSAAGTIHGAWAKIGFDNDSREQELDLLVELDDHLIPVRLPLVGTLEDSLRVSSRDSRRLFGYDLARWVAMEKHHERMLAATEPIVSVVLYLCSANAEMRSSAGAARRGRPAPRSRRSGELVWPAAAEPVFWATGTRLGAALRRAQDRLQDPDAEGTGVAVRPHIRRAHWHAFWVGAHDSPDRHRDVRWLPPIPVNLDEDEGPELATIRPVPPAG